MKRFIPFIPLIVLLVLVALIFFALHRHFSMKTLYEAKEHMKQLVEMHFIKASVAFILIYAIFRSVSFPGNAIFALIGGFLFPLPLSTLYVVLSTTLGAACIFLVARTAFKERLKKITGSRLAKMEEGFKKNAWGFLIFLRLIPLVPFWLINVSAVIFQVPFRTFLWTTFVGVIPIAYVFTQAGAGIGEMIVNDEPLTTAKVFNTQIILSLVALGLLIAIAMILRQRFEKKS